MGPQDCPATPACGRGSKTMRRCLALILLAFAAACAPPHEQAPEAAPDEARELGAATARRIVSLDYCADQYLLKLVDRDRILAVSPDATASFSYMHEEAVGVAQVRPHAEDVLVIEPDLIVRSYGGGPNARAFFEHAGVPVVQLGYAADIAGVRAVIEEMSIALGVPERGADIVADMDARLAAVARANTGANTGDSASALYMTPAGVTAGPGTLVHEIFAAAGYSNFQSSSGWRALPLERLAYERPDLVAMAYFGARANSVNAWTAARHPVARRQMTDRPTVAIDGAWTACGGWFLVDAVEALSLQAHAPDENGSDPS